MLRRKYFWPRPRATVKLLRRMSLIFFCSILLMLLFSTTAFARSITSPSDSVVFQQLEIGPGFQVNPSRRSGFWVPAFATVRNEGRATFNGSLVVRTYNGFARTASQGLIASQQSFSVAVSLAAGTQKRYTIDVPFNTSPFTPQGIMADLLDSHGKTLKTLNRDVATANQSDIVVGVLSEHFLDFLNGPLNGLALPNQGNAVDVVPLNASTFPDQAAVLENFEVIVLDDFPSSTLSSQQFAALETWVNQGGALIEVGGSEWQRTLGQLPSNLRPVDIDDTIDLPAGTHLLADSGLIQQPGSPDALSAPITVSTALMRTPENTGAAFTDPAVMASESVPMVIQTHQGQGNISYLAFDPISTPFANWSGIKLLWTHLLARALGDQLLISAQAQRYSSGPGALLARGGMISSLEPNVGIPLWIFVVLLLSYIAILGPARLLFTRHAKRPFWNWRIVVSSIVVFSLISYGAAFYQKGASLTDNSVSLLDLNQSGSLSHVTTYMGVFVSSQDNFKLHIPGVSLAQTIADPLFSTGSDVTDDSTPTPVQYGANSTDVSLLNAGMWTFHPLVYEQDRQFHSGISTQLTLRGNKLVGSIKNTLPTAMSDVYVLLPHSFVVIGNLPAGGTVKINQSLQSIAANPNALLANQIAEHNNLPAPYFPYANQGQPQNDTQRHIAELAALSGAGNSFAGCGGPCSTNAIISASKNIIIAPRLGTPRLPLFSGDDPLLIDGAAATLIGWSDQALDGTGDMTINGQHTHGYHDNLIRMPLTMNLAAPFNFPDDLISGKVVDVQGSDIEMVQPGIYSLPTGTVSFEFALPDLGDGGTSQIKSVAISIPNTLNGPTPPMPDITYMQARVYNWQNDSWDKISISRTSLTVSNPNTYIGPDGRILLQLSNQNANQGLVYFSRPAVSLN